MMDTVGDRHGAEVNTQLFETKSDAALYLAGLSGFWAGFAVICLSWLAYAPGFAITVGLAVLVGGWVAANAATRKLEQRLTGKRVRPWPFGYPRLRTQIQATLPSTVIAAARRLGLNAVLVTSTVYALLAIDFVAFIGMWYTRR